MSDTLYNDIQTIEGLEAVRKRPGMYVGSTTCQEGKAPRALMQLFQEVLSNSVDEALVGYGDTIEVTIKPDQTLVVKDYARGIPYGDKGDAVIRSATVLHSSGKFDSNAYAKSGGQHGIGLKAANALSEWLEIDVKRSDCSYRIKFKQEEILEHDTHSKRDMSGTTISFLPDASIFESIVWDAETIQDKLNNTAYLTPGVSYKFIDERTEPISEYNYHHENGIMDLVNYQTGDMEHIGFKQPLLFSGNYAIENGKVVQEVGSDYDGLMIDVELSFTYIEDIGETLLSFVNGIPTTEGGPHVTGVRRGLWELFTEFGNLKKLLKGKDKLDGKDVRDGLVAVVSLGIPESLASFEGQVKEKLGTAVAQEVVQTLIKTKVSTYLYDHETQTKAIFDKILDAKAVREMRKDAEKLKSIERKQKKSQSRLLISDKLTPASSKDPKARELFIVEGDSAGGTAKRGRDSKTQAIMPLRGKPFNVSGQRLSKILSNTELSTLFTELGCGLKDDFNYDALRYDKIIIMTDADDDGAHIQNLLILALWTLTPEVVKRGHVYVANPPLYRFDRYKNGKRELAFALDKAEYSKMIKTHASWNVTRLKGLGEMRDVDLKYTTMSPETRILSRITVEDAKRLTRLLELFMGSSDKNGKSAAHARRDWLQENGIFEQD